MSIYIPNYKHCCQALDECFIASLPYKTQHNLRQAIVGGSRLTILESGRYICELSKILYVYAATWAPVKSLDEVYQLGRIDQAIRDSIHR